MHTAWRNSAWVTAQDISRSRTGQDLDGLNRAASALRTERKGPFLDIGCGYGGLSRLVGDHLESEEIHGIDIDPRVIPEAREKGVIALQHDAGDEPLPYRAESLQYVMTLGMMDYLTFFDGLVRECHRVLAFGGRIMVSLPNWQVGIIGSCWWLVTNRATLRYPMRSLSGYRPRISVAATPRQGISTSRRFAPFVNSCSITGSGKSAILPGSPRFQTNNRIFQWADNLAGRSPYFARRFYYIGEKVATRPMLHKARDLLSASESHWMEPSPRTDLEINDGMGTGTFKHNFPDIRRVGSKREALINLARGRRVLHVGCTDAPFTADKLRSGDLLHRELLDVASWVGGVDIDADGLEMLRRELHGEYFCTDVCVPDETVRFPEFDVIIAGDVVEHVPNEGAFLRVWQGLQRCARGVVSC